MVLNPIITSLVMRSDSFMRDGAAIGQLFGNYHLCPAGSVRRIPYSIDYDDITISFFDRNGVLLARAKPNPVAGGFSRADHYNPDVYGSGSTGLGASVYSAMASQLVDSTHSQFLQQIPGRDSGGMEHVPATSSETYAEQTQASVSNVGFDIAGPWQNINQSWMNQSSRGLSKMSFQTMGLRAVVERTGIPVSFTMTQGNMVVFNTEYYQSLVHTKESVRVEYGPFKIEKDVMIMSGTVGLRVEQGNAQQFDMVFPVIDWNAGDIMTVPEIRANNSTAMKPVQYVG